MPLTEDTKVCSKCKERKPVSEFYWNSYKKRYREYCKKCWYTNNKKRQDKHYKLHKEKEDQKTNIRHRIEYRCAKVFCKNVSKNVIKLICPVCNKEFGVMKKWLYHYNRDGTKSLRKYCSRACQFISMTKEYREKSPYAKKINELQKIHGM